MGSNPSPSSPAARKRMQAVRQQGTAAELKLRSVLHKAGLRFRVQLSPIKGLRRRADIVFPKIKVAVFVDGCFWHSCPLHRTEPKSNAEWWAEKLKENVRRDRDTDRKLKESGWVVLRYWEHEDPSIVAQEILRVVRRLYEEIS